MWKKIRLKLKGYKTTLLSWITGAGATIIWILPDLINFFSTSELVPLIPVKYAVYVTVGLAIATFLVRKYGTTTAIFKKE